jgi:hypothetical protein
VRRRSPPRIELTLDPATVHIERFEDVQDLLHFILREVLLSPEDDIKVLFQNLETVENGVDRGRVPEFPLKQTEILLLEFDPEGLTLKMLHPSVPEEPVPVLADPLLDRLVSQVPALLLAENPLETLGLLLPTLLQAQLSFGKHLEDRW